MPRISVAALVLALAALAFALGYYARSSPEPPRGGTPRAPRAATPSPPGGVSAAVQTALSNPDLLERSAQLARLLQGLSPEALGEVKATYDAFFIDVGDVEIVLLAEWWAGFDPESAFQWTRSEWEGRHPAVVTAVVRVWARRDPEEAARAVAGIRDPVGHRQSVEALVQGWDESGEPGLANYLAQMRPGPTRQRAIAILARRKVLRDGAEEAFRWAEGLSDDAPGRFKLQVSRRVASAAAEVDPPRAAAWAERHAAEEHGRGLLRRVGTRWAERDGQAAMSWLATLPAGKDRDTAVQESYRIWLSRDRQGAMAWMRGAEIETWLDPALAMFAQAVSRESPEEGLEWAAQVLDAERRQRTTVSIGRQWLGDDPDAARSWLDRSDLAPEIRERILTPRRERRRLRPAPPEEDAAPPEES